MSLKSVTRLVPDLSGTKKNKTLFNNNVIELVCYYLFILMTL